MHYRDTTFFRVGDGTLTDYAMGVLIANAAWTAGKVLVLWCSRQAASATTKIHTYPRQWALSGPRYLWEEEEAEKTMSVYSDCASEVNVLQWSWKEGTRVRVWDAYEF